MSWAVALHGVLGRLRMDLTFRAEESPLVIIGPNGAGKSTVLRAIAGAQLPLQGSIALDGRCLFDSSRGIDVPPFRRRIGYVPQGYGLFPNMTAEGNVAFGCGRGRDSLARARKALDRFGAGHLALRSPPALSDGEKQRVALARAIATEPDGLLLDEPLAALDPTVRRRMRAFFAEHLRETERPAIVVTHDVRDLAVLGGTLLVIERGRVVQSGTAEEVEADPVSDFVAEFFDADVGDRAGRGA